MPRYSPEGWRELRIKTLRNMGPARAIAVLRQELSSAAAELDPWLSMWRPNVQYPRDTRVEYSSRWAHRLIELASLVLLVCAEHEGRNDE